MNTHANGKSNGFLPTSVESRVSEPFLTRIYKMMCSFIFGLWNAIYLGWKPHRRDLGVMGTQINENTWIKTEGSGLDRGYKILDELKLKNVNTTADILGYLVNKYGDAPMLGTRKLLKRNRIEKTGGKILEKLQLGDYEWKSYREINHEVCQVASAFNNMGLKKGERIALLAETRADWFVSAMGCHKNGLTVVTLYTNLSDSGLAHGINETEVQSIITTFDVLPRLVGIIPICPTIKTIIVIEDQLEGIGNTNSIPKNVNVIPFADLKKYKININEANKPTPNDLAIIMYTSGSSGIPKGVELTHSNIFYSMSSYLLQADVGMGDVYLAFLPLAHIMELLSEICQVVQGSQVAYGSPFTLTSNGPKIAKGTLGDAVLAKPTTITAVSLILDRIIKGISLKVSKAGILQQKLFETALATKLANEHSIMSKIYDAVVFKKVRAELGGRLKMMVVGGAPLSADTHNKIRAMFGITLQCGYGCTETCASAASMQAYDSRPGHVGPPNFLTLIKLENWKEGGYLTTDKPFSRGEIVIGSGCVAKRYFKNEEETNNSFYYSEGTNWFRTGDIGEFDETGVLRIIDRKKDLVKLVNGEYVSLGGVESLLKTHSLVETICLFADSLQEHPVCVVVPNQNLFLKQMKKEFDCEDLTIDDVCSNKKMSDDFLKELQDYGRKHGLNRWDIPQSIFLTPIPWTPDNGLVTAGFKLRRRNLQVEFRLQIQAMYAK